MREYTDAHRWWRRETLIQTMYSGCDASTFLTELWVVACLVGFENILCGDNRTVLICRRRGVHTQQAQDPIRDRKGQQPADNPRIHDAFSVNPHIIHWLSNSFSNNIRRRDAIMQWLIETEFDIHDKMRIRASSRWCYHIALVLHNFECYLYVSRMLTDMTILIAWKLITCLACLRKPLFCRSSCPGECSSVATSQGPPAFLLSLSHMFFQSE